MSGQCSPANAAAFDVFSIVPVAREPQNDPAMIAASLAVIKGTTHRLSLLGSTWFNIDVLKHVDYILILASASVWNAREVSIAI